MTDRETVVVKDSGTGTGMTAIVAIVVFAIVLLAGWYLLMGPGAGTTTNTNDGPDVNITLPSAPAPEAS